MRGGLRWLARPFQVLCVLVAVLLTAAFSLCSSSARPRGGNALIFGGRAPRCLGERLSSRTITLICRNPNAGCLTIIRDPSGVIEPAIRLVGIGRGASTLRFAGV